MQNLLNETKFFLTQNGKTLDDVVWFGSPEFEISREQFIELADQFYNSGFGKQEVASDLVLVGEDFWLERHEYDGAEHWEFKQLPQRPKVKKTIRCLMGGAWDTLFCLNFDERRYS